MGKDDLNVSPSSLSTTIVGRAWTLTRNMFNYTRCLERRTLIVGVPRAF